LQLNRDCTPQAANQQQLSYHNSIG